MQQHLHYDEVAYCYDAKPKHTKHAHRRKPEDDEDLHSLLEHVPTEEYYYDEHPLLEDVMTEGPLQHHLVHYLTEVLQWLYDGKVCALHGNLGIYQSPDGEQPSLAPDLCMFRGIAPDWSTFRSWKIGKTGPAPHVVFEIASKSTWEKDVEDKPKLYAHMGVKEYFLYDPAMPPVMKDRPRLRGWKRNRDGGMEELVRYEADWLWSQQLESYLGADGTFLRLYDNHKQLRLTKAEALEQDNDALAEDNDTLEQEKRDLTREKRLVEQRARALAQEKQRAEQRAQTLAQEKLLAEQRAQTSELHAQTLAQEKQQVEQEKLVAEQRAHALAEKLRALGINPDDLA